MNIDRERVLCVFKNYAQKYDLEDPKIKLKYDHTFRVAGLCDKIACSLGLEKEDQDLAWLSGVLHDIGRFEQVRRYGTFIDAQSVDHAHLSADILFRQGMIREFVDDDAQDVLLDKAVWYHSIYKLPESLTDRQRLYANILRDADKVDILRVNCDTPVTEIYNLPEEAFKTALISDEVFSDIKNGQNVNRAHSRTAIDFLIGHIAFVFGLVYPESVRQMRDQGYLEKMMNYPTENSETQCRMKEIRKMVHGYMEERIQTQSMLEENPALQEMRLKRTKEENRI